MSQDEKNVGLQVTVPLRWADMDAYGHINNVNIVRLMEEARIAALGVPGGTGAAGIEAEIDLFGAVPEGTQVLVVEHRVRYRRPLEYRNEPTPVRVWVQKLSGASVVLGYSFTDAVTGEECVRASTTLAFVHEGRPQRINAQQRKLLAPYLV
ncbi:acyl-CoA thioesterase [Micrococcoides hystricis]|uniref:Acyl-CoA thioesterase n=1 Tax=Micrococcoides hystricis TaxID=1572761 RepID=A0ABV6PBX0_9MICC